MAASLTPEPRLRLAMLLAFALSACTPSADTSPEDSVVETGTSDSANGDSGTDSATDSADTGTFDPPDSCPTTEAGIQDVTSEAGTYLIGHLDAGEVGGSTVVFLPGGDGKGPNGTAANGFDAFFGINYQSLGYTIVVPYVTEDGYPTTVVPDVGAILDEVLACWGGDASRVHLIGHSNGGYLAYNVVGPDLADRWVTITGAPAYFQRLEKNKLEGIAFDNCAGEDDPDWLEAMTEADADLREAGFESQLTVWAHTGHVPQSDWEGQDEMFAFLDAHPTR